MITITRRLAQQLRSVLRRAFGNFRGNGPAIGFIAGKEGLTVRSVFGNVAVECRLPGERTAEALWLPFEFLVDVAGKNDQPLEIEATGDGQANVQWRASNGPQIVTYATQEPFEADKFPVLPAAFTANPPGLLQALDAAAEVTALEGVRYGTDCIQLSPDGTINATDGRQLLIQSGFNFPWQDAVLVSRNKVFTCAELPQDQPVAVAKSGDWVAVRSDAGQCICGSTQAGIPACRILFPIRPVPRPACSFPRTTSDFWSRPFRSFLAKTTTTPR